MALQQQLMELEKRFWTGDSAFYRANVDGQCLVAFTGMAGVFSNEQVADMIGEGQRWDNLTLTERGFLPIGDDVAALTYEASASRPDGEPYKALVSSLYVRRTGGWKMAIHQQTPLADD